MTNHQETTYVIPDTVKALSLDVWGTLIVANKRFAKRRLKMLFELLGHGKIDVDKVYPIYRQSNKYFDNLSETTGADFGMRERVAMMYELLGITAAPPDPITVRWLQRESAKLRLKPQNMPNLIEPDLCDTLASFRKSGYTIGLLSNTGMDSRVVMEPVLKRLGVWDHTTTALFSCEDGRAKPNPGLFREMARRLDYAPDEVLHVGDNRVADLGATKAGLHAVLYAPEGDTMQHVTSLRQLKKHRQ